LPVAIVAFDRQSCQEGTAMKAKTLLAASMLLVLIGLVGGCRYNSYDDYRDYGYASGGSSTYREGCRDGRAYERRNSSGWRDGRYADRRDGNWWRW